MAGIAWPGKRRGKCPGSVTATWHLLPILAGYGINAYATNAAYGKANCCGIGGRKELSCRNSEVMK